MKAYKFFRGLLKASAFATVMFVMQACYGAPHPIDDFETDEEEYVVDNDTPQNLEKQTALENEAE